MRYFGLIQPHYRPFLRGRGSLLNFEFKCHKFLPGVGTLNEDEPYLFKLIPGQFSDHTLHGPASLLNRTIVYPCDKFMCQIGCCCRKCRRKNEKVSSQTLSEHEIFKYEYEDHKLHHRAIHLECIFCLEIQKIFPFYMFLDYKSSGSFINMKMVPTNSFIFEHEYQDIRSGAEFSSLDCHVCEKRFSKISHLKRHMKSVHYGEKNQCDHCELVFSRQDKLLKHIGLAHTNKKVPASYQCSQCKQLFKENSNYQRHTKTNGISKYQCKVCDETFCIARDLAKHTKSEHSKQLQCQRCDKKFTKKWNLTRHLQVRTELLCEQCGKYICSEYDLVVHKNSHDVDNCPICGVCYDLENLKWHLYAEHQQLYSSYFKK